MVDRLVKYCDRHPEQALEPVDPTLGELNAQPVAIVFAAETFELASCRLCVTQLREWIGPRAPSNYSGTIRGPVNKLPYVRRRDDIPTESWKLLPTLDPPKFQS